MKNQMSIVAFVALVLLFLGGCGAEIRSASEAAIRIDCTEPVAASKATYQGERDRSACAWKGVEFGAPPVGELRFQFATPSTTTGPVDATAFGNSCVQGAGGHVESFRTVLTFGEDCLNLNLWAPGSSVDGKPQTDLPVMVWIYGGGFSSGSGNSNLYSGEPLTKHDVIVVTLNYRLGALGWLGVTDATDAAGRTLAGNFGLSDQILALEWVRDNIAAFGGDPRNVTIFGESAGGYSICALLASPKADGLFKQAIMESGACLMAGSETHQEKSKAWMKSVACPVTAPASLDCLRNLDAAWLAENASWPLFGIDAPVVDGVFLLEQPVEALQGSGRKVPLLAGFNSDEVKLLGLVNRHLMKKRSEPWSEMWATIDAAIGEELGQRLRAAYPQANYESPYELLSEGATDVLFSCPARGAVMAGNQPSWLYRFRIKPGSYFLDPYAGTFHAAEIPFVFGNFNLLTVLFQENDSLAHAMELSRNVQQYWTTFAKTGDPNGPGLPMWERHGDEEFLMELSTPLGSSMGLLRDRCEIWDEAAPAELNAYFFEFVPSLAGVESLF